jgi:hypothetical protein
VIAAHCVQSYGHHGLKVARNRRALNALCFDYFNYFAALVLATMRAGAMGANLLMTVGALGQLGDHQRIMGAAGRRTPFAVAAFRIWHYFPTF